MKNFPFGLLPPSESVRHQMTVDQQQINSFQHSSWPGVTEAHELCVSRSMRVYVSQRMIRWYQRATGPLGPAPCDSAAFSCSGSSSEALCATRTWFAGSARASSSMSVHAAAGDTFAAGSMALWGCEGRKRQRNDRAA